MTSDGTNQQSILKHPAVPWVTPFLAFVAILSISDYLHFLGRWEYPLRCGFLTAVIYHFSRRVLSFRVVSWTGSIGLGVAVFVLWIDPDLLFPGYRQLFSGTVLGTLKSSLPSEYHADPMVLFFRTVRAALLVPILEELFWRGWLMRYLIKPDFLSLPLGAYSRSAFWITAVLFALEHGVFWDVGLACGLIYNWWMVRTRSLGDLILVHAVTNACLSFYVIWAKQWQYW